MQRLKIRCLGKLWLSTLSRIDLLVLNIFVFLKSQSPWIFVNTFNFSSVSHNWKYETNLANILIRQKVSWFLCMKHVAYVYKIKHRITYYKMHVIRKTGSLRLETNKAATIILTHMLSLCNCSCITHSWRFYSHKWKIESSRPSPDLHTTSTQRNCRYWKRQYRPNSSW